jgi:hypothetical protein
MKWNSFTTIGYQNAEVTVEGMRISENEEA